MMQVLTLAKKDQAETEEQRQHAETANNERCTVADPFAATHDGPLAAGEASSRSDGQDDTKGGVAMLSQLLASTKPSATPLHLVALLLTSHVHPKTHHQQIQFHMPRPL